MQLYGERNSGTTFLARVLQDNMREPKNMLGMLERDETPLGHKIFGYKHWFIDTEKLKDPRSAETLFVVIYRDPYFWVRAMMDRPYALERSIGGRSVGELPAIKLEGFINGRATQNEQEPKTGKELTLFELRRKKIESFEHLSTLVDNVVYIRLEDLLEDVSGEMSRIFETFGSVFREERDFTRKPFKLLLEEHRASFPFSETDREVLDSAIDWATERRVGYQPYRPDPKIGERAKIIIIHGGSGVGKTHLMHHAAANREDVVCLEMDDCQYWQDKAPEVSLSGLQKLIPAATEHSLHTLLMATKPRSVEAKRCMEFLFKSLASHLGTDPSGSVLLATCGALPDPSAPNAPSLYAWLSDHLPLSFFHVLVDIPRDVHRDRIAKRGRTHLLADIERLHAKKLANREAFDAVISDGDGLTAYLNTVSRAQTLPDPPKAGKTPMPQIRVKKAVLKYVQIYGERSSGTKYLASILANHMTAPDRILGSYANNSDPVNKAKLIGYKHYYPRPDKVAKYQHETLFLVIYKNPYTWTRSMLLKPYHFKACMAGKVMADLADLRLLGLDGNGNEIPDVHPETGEKVTLFELRKHKILEWEKLAGVVPNVVYMNYETLLVSPTEIMQQILDAFPSLFASAKALNHQSDPKYIEKYVTPKPFSKDELAVIDANIDWSVEAIAGYRKGNLFI